MCQHSWQEKKEENEEKLEEMINASKGQKNEYFQTEKTCAGLILSGLLKGLSI